jgi:hypothetical protein
MRPFACSRPVFPVSAFPIKSWGELIKIFIKTRSPAPFLFISGFSKATYKYFNFFGPWTAFVQGPLLNSCVMNVIMTNINDHPVKNRMPIQRAHFARAPRLPSGNKLEVSCTFSSTRPGPAPLKKSQVAVKETVNKLTN